MEKTEKKERLNTYTAVNYEHIATSVLCFFFSQASLLRYMTPFGMAFFASSFTTGGWYYSLAAGVLGAIISRGDTSFMRYLLSLCVTASVLGLSDRRDKTFFKAITISVTYLLISIIFLSMSDSAPYYFMLQTLETFICFVSVYLLDSILPLTISYSKRSVISHSECVGLLTIVSIFVLSLCRTGNIFGISPASFLVAFLIMSISLNLPTSEASMVGMILGVVLSLGNRQSMSIVGAYGFCAFMAGLFNRYSKVGVVLGFTLANAIITAFFNDTKYALVNPAEAFFAGVFFITLPGKFHSFAKRFFKKISCTTVSYTDGASLLVKKRLDVISDAFDNISKIYGKECKSTHIGKNYITKLFDYAADNVCSGCGMKYGCWRNSQQSNYGYMLSMFEKIRKTGAVSLVDMPGEFAAKCVKKEEFVKVLNIVYEIYKTDKLWMDKMCETKELMAGQLKGISSAVKNISADMGRSSDGYIENHLRSKLDREGIIAGDIRVVVSNEKIYCVYVELCDNDHGGEIDKIEKIVSDSVEIPMRYNDSITDADLQSLYFYPAEEYRIVTAKASISKDGERVCGDCADTLLLPDGTAYVMLSDGMGSGEKAMNQSRDALDMLSAFVKAGFDLKSSVSLINSSLILKNSKECFATLDILCVNLKTGEFDISKIASAPTYVKLGSSVKVLDSTSLPIGIIRETEADTTHLISDDNYTLVVMMSDGITNTILKDSKCSDWIKKELGEINTKNPRLVANRILECAVKRTKNVPDDDMTVVVSYIYKN